MPRTTRKSIKIPNVTPARQTINSSTNNINIPFKGTTKNRKKTFSFQTQQRALPRHHVLYKVASNVTNKFPIHLNRTELNWTCSIFVQWTSRVEFYEFHVTAFFMLFFSFTISFLDQNGRRHTNKPSDRMNDERHFDIKTVWRRNCR